MKNKILIVGDDSSQTETLETLLRDEDYDVQAISNKNIGAAAANPDVPDLIIVQTGDAPGKAESSLRVSGNWQTVPMLLLGTAPEGDLTEYEGFSGGLTAYLQPPFSPVRLASKTACLMERGRMQKIVRKKDFRFLSLIENSSDLITVLALDGTIYYESPSATQILGREPQTDLGISAFDFIHPEDRRRTVAHLKKAVPNPPFDVSVEYRYLHQNGSWCLLESVGRLAEDPTRGTVIVINSRDIGKRRRSELALRESEERFKAQYKGIPIPTYTWQKTGDDFVFSDCNDAAEKSTQGKIKELLGLKATVIYDHAPNVILNLHRCYEERTTISDEISYLFKTTGERRQLDMNYVFVPPDLVMVHTRDITESIESAESLRSSENRFQLVARATNDALWDWNMETGAIWLNDIFFEMFGYRREDITPGIDFWEGNVHAEDKERVAKKLHDFIKSSESYWTAEYRYRRHDGTYADIYDRAYAMRDQNGRATRMIGAMMDVTERRKVENAVRFQALLLDTVEQAVIATNFEGLITYWNKFAENLFGWTAAEVLNRDVLNYTVSKVSFDESKNIMRQLRRGRNWTGELMLRRRDDTIFPAQMMSSPVQNEQGERVGMLAIITDISESKRAKTENVLLNTQIEAQRQRLNTIIANIPGVVWETRLEKTNADRYVNFVSDYVEKMIGYTVEEWLSAPDFWLQIMHSEDRERADLEIASFIENKGTSVQQYRWIAKDGTVVWVETQMVLINDDDGKPFSLRGISIDVSERKLIEDALQKSEEQLRQSQKLESVGRLAGGIAHDFNNMLTAINGYSDLILRELGEDDDSLRKKVVEIKKAGERSAALTHQLLAFSRRQVLQPKLIDLNRVITDMNQLLLRLIGEDIQLNIALDSQPSYVEADPGQLSQVIMNLVVNARDAMPKGGEVIVKTGKVLFENEPVVQFAPEKKGTFIVLSVIDNGIGIEDRISEQIFEPFFTTKQVGVGTGLGLSTVYGIVKQSGGFIWVTSKVGEGAEFRIYLPFIERGSEKKEKTRVEQFPHGTETILLVEDEDMVRDLTRRILELCGYNIIEARNGIEALKICGETDCYIDLLMTDVVMPQMNGRELSEKMNEIRPQIKTLFTSGYMNDRVMRHGVSEDEVDFIQKPFAPDALARKVREMLDRKN